MKGACLGALFLSFLLCAQTVVIPQSGFIFDAETKSIRPINGVPGSGTLGPALAGVPNITAASVCSPLHFALIASGPLSAVSVFGLPGASAFSTPDGLLSAPDRIVLNSSCSAALLYVTGTKQLQIVTGLPNAPVLTAVFSPVLGAVSSFALSDDGTTIVCVVPNDGVYVLSPSAAPLSIVPLTGNAAVTFRNRTDALIADTDGNQILLASNVVSAMAVEVLANSDQGVSAPASVAYDSAKQLVLFGNLTSAELGLLNMADSSTEFLPCNCPDGLTKIGNEFFEVAAPGSGLPLLVLDTAILPHKVLFVAARQ